VTEVMIPSAPSEHLRSLEEGRDRAANIPAARGRRDQRQPTKVEMPSVAHCRVPVLDCSSDRLHVDVAQVACPGVREQQLAQRLDRVPARTVACAAAGSTCSKPV
jgi:hypothetical protein